MMQDQTATILAVPDHRIRGPRVTRAGRERGISDHCLAGGGVGRTTLEP